LILLGVGKGDSEEAARRLADKVMNLRIFSNAEGKFDRSLLDEKGAALVISQFTLFGEAKGGRRPDFTGAAGPDLARPLYERYAELLRGLGGPPPGFHRRGRPGRGRTSLPPLRGAPGRSRP
jgi:D-tyrosyl-tRNA(Tyr) deacylase